MKVAESAPTWAAFVLIAVMGVMLFLRSGGPPQPDPEAVIHRVFRAAAAGDISKYLDCFTGELRTKLEAARRETGDERFRKDIVESAAGITGIAISRPAATEAPIADGKTALVVERVFRDRNEGQTHVLSFLRGRWRIESIGPATTVKMPIPYGTPVYAAESPAAGDANRDISQPRGP